MATVAPSGTAALADVSVLVALPGTGSDADYARRAFTPLADALGLPLAAVDPGPDGVETAYLRALEVAAAGDGSVLVAGISIGACVGVGWALESDACAGVVAAMPPWLFDGESAPSPAALSALATVDLIDRLGIDGATAEMRVNTPAWLGEELARSWRSIGAPLRSQLGEAAAMRTPTAGMLSALGVPLAVVGVRDDPIHPHHNAERWAHLAPRSSLRSIAFDAWGDDPGTIGRAAASAWAELA
ncbi:alpha/beta hydrolase [Williamsia herbipolensis]|uniref:Alpha/beta hydrolase n=1 Tax=Williamsia herbipolensis TaxID=1603258 RepID=A0AAU4K371_9NOCA|nr:alpha/beta hydrolase [Williamsia herbipolensis]